VIRVATIAISGFVRASSSRVILEEPRRVARALLHALQGRGKLARIDVAEPDDLASAAGHGLAEDVAAPPTAADQHSPVATPRRLAGAQLRGHSRPRSRRQRGAEESPAARGTARDAEAGRRRGSRSFRG
jgi:hypothetical protein